MLFAHLSGLFAVCDQVYVDGSNLFVKSIWMFIEYVTQFIVCNTLFTDMYSSFFQPFSQFTVLIYLYAVCKRLFAKYSPIFVGICYFSLSYNVFLKCYFSG